MTKAGKILYVGNNLSKHGNTPGTVETLGVLFEKENIEVIYAGHSLNKMKRLFEMCSSVIKNRNQIKYVLIDTYSTSAFWFAFSVGMISRTLNIKYIPILHGGNLPERLQKSKWCSDLLFKNSFENVAVSGYLNYHFQKNGYKSIIIPNNIEIGKYKFKKRNKISPSILWVRSFHADYNPNLAIDVLEIVAKKYPQAKLCMVGPDKDGSMEVFKKYAEEKSLIDKIKVTGRLPKEEWHTLSEEYDIFINTTNYDNTPVSVLEAMALGLPVVTTSVGGIPFLLDHGKDALLVEKNNKEQMAKAITDLLESQDLVNSITENALNKVSNFDWEVVKHKWINLLS